MTDTRPPGWHLNRTRTLADVWNEGELNARRRAPPPTTDARWRLVDAKGNFLHQSGQGMTGEAIYAWQGSSAQLDKAMRCLTAAAGLKAVRITA